VNEPLVRHPLARSLEGQPDVLGLQEIGIFADQPAGLTFAHPSQSFAGKSLRFGVVVRCGRSEKELRLALDRSRELRIPAKALLHGVVAEGVGKGVAVDERSASVIV
jgi:hypothetical protein